VERPADLKALEASRGPSVQMRVSLVVFGCAVAVAAALYAMQATQQGQVETLFRERAVEAGRGFSRVLESRSRMPRMHVNDYSRWDELVQFLHTNDRSWADIQLTHGIPTFGLDVAWVLDAQRRLCFTGVPGPDSTLGDLPVPIDRLGSVLARTPASHFFAVTPRGLIEVWANSVVPSRDLQHLSRPEGYYLVGYLWTPERIAELARFAGGSVAAVPATGAAGPTRAGAKTGRIEVQHALPGIDGVPVAKFVFTSSYDLARQVEVALRRAALLVLFGVVFLLAVVWWAVGRWVGWPLRAIARAMAHEDSAELAGVIGRRDELGRVARLFDEFLVQRGMLIEAREAAEAATRAKSQFLANISHELRTPMHGILSFARFGMRDAQTAPRQDLLDNFSQVNECGESLLALLNALLDLSKFEAGRVTLEFDEVYLPDVIDVAVDEFRSLYHERQIELRVEAEPGLSDVIADRARMLQVMRNVISNAAKFTPPGGSVVARVASGGKFQVVTVEDSGIGIPPGEEELIFNNFTQATGTHARSGGTGLGLAICREIVEAHEGRIRAENREVPGTRVVIEVPIQGPAAAHTKDGSSPARATEAAAGKATPPSRTPATHGRSEHAA
jgi:signal transduction histidine kinase